MSALGGGGPIDEPSLELWLADHEERIRILEALVQRIDTVKEVIDVNTAADHTIVAGVADRVLRVITLSFLCGGDLSLVWKDTGGKQLSGEMNFPERGGISDSYAESGHWEDTDVGEGVVLQLNDAEQVGGYISVEVRDPE